MMKTILLGASLLAFSVACNGQQQNKKVNTVKQQTMKAGNIYSYKVPSLAGGDIDFSDFRGKKILVVNTASECGYTPQYEDLQKLYEQYKDRLVIVGFPANNFGGQEPGSNEEIKTFCEANYGVSFPMAAKVSVKGDDEAPIFKYLTRQELNGVKDTDIKWNFTKFLLDENGRLIDSFPSKVKPTDGEIVKYLK
ncbi:MAG: glutathione peroxidase [Chryseobacterium sp.]|nr:MAG: glutathione peroxidase [Chryseobacterium sp.]